LLPHFQTQYKNRLEDIQTITPQTSTRQRLVLENERQTCELMLMLVGEEVIEFNHEIT
jgi:hypothetical protein